MEQPVTPRPAATTVLLRPGAPLEVFLIKRAVTVQFMGGTHVFPGGRMDDGDRQVVTDGRIKHPNPAQLAAHMGLPAPEALAFLVAGARELLEEAGVLLGAPASDVEVMRAQLNAKEPFTAILQRHGVTLDGGSLAYVAHWVTPVIEPRRFTARFFVTQLPQGQQPVIDAHEAVEGAWMTPRDAVAAHLAGTLSLPPPTLCILEGLAAAPSLEHALRPSATPVVTVEPVFVDDAGTPTLAFPGDVLHPEATGVPGAPTRVELRDGRFVTASRPR